MDKLEDSSREMIILYDSGRKMAILQDNHSKSTGVTFLSVLYLQAAKDHMLFTYVPAFTCGCM